jgi:hypothetical protein
VSRYEKYKGRVQFVIVDLDRSRSAAQRALESRFYRGSIPHVTIIESSSQIVYNQAGEADESVLSSVLGRALK